MITHDKPSTLRETSTKHVRSIRKRRKPRVTHKIRRVWKSTPAVIEVDKYQCVTCNRILHERGFYSHRAMHRRKGEEFQFVKP